jgi:hypothetical protein
MQECLLGNLVADAMLWKVNSVDPTPYQIALQNGGGLRASIDAGPVSVGEILEVLPFGNAIATFEITGTHIISALENGVSAFGTGSGTGRFPQVSGLRYTWDPNATAGSRIVSVQVLDRDTGIYEPLDEMAIYRVVTNDFMRQGGDGYDVFNDDAINPYDFGPALDEALKEYVEQFSPVSPVLDGRILTLGPDIFVTPLALDVNLAPGGLVTETVTLLNKGDQALSWSLTVSPTVGWLATDPISGTLTPEEVVVTGTATLLLPKSIDVAAVFSEAVEGVYTTTLIITSNDPDEPTINVDVTLTAAFNRIFLPIVIHN